jgi:hemolysin activation/secretion protein
MKNIKFIILSIILLSSYYVGPSYAGISNIERQDQIIRMQQEEEKRRKTQREFEKIRREREQLKKQVEESREEEEESDKLSQCLTVKSIEIIGAESLSKKLKQRIINKFIGRCIDENILQKIVNETQNIYQKLGLVTTQILVPQQNITKGYLAIEVIEGKIEEIILNNNKFTDNMQLFTAFGFKEGKLLDIDDINQGIHQMNRLESNNAKMQIKPGEKTGYSKVIINNASEFPASVQIGYDNLGNEFTGERRTKFAATLNNLLFLNDQINLSYNINLDDPSNEKDLKSFTAGISIPYTYNIFSYDYSRTRYKGQNAGDNEPIKLSGFSDSNNVAIDRTILRNNEYRISTNVGLTTKKSASYLNDSKIETSERKLTIGSISLALSKYFKNGASIYLKPQYVKGLKLLNAQKDESGPSDDIPRAQFQLWRIDALLSKQFEVPKLKLPITLSTKINGQISEYSLFGSEQFTIGGYSTVRGFKENNISGDHGYNFMNKASFNLGQLLVPIFKAREGNNLELLYKFTMEPFYDYGYVKTKYNAADGRLSGAGIKTIYSSEYFDASITYAWAIGKSNFIASTDKENKMLYFEIGTKCC